MHKPSQKLSIYHSFTSLISIIFSIVIKNVDNFRVKKAIFIDDICHKSFYMLILYIINLLFLHFFSKKKFLMSTFLA